MMDYFMNMIIKIMKVIFYTPIYLFAKIFPKNNELYIIGSSLGYHFSDNSKYFFIYVHRTFRENGKKKLIWVTKSKLVENKLKSMNLPVVNIYSINGVYIVLRASKSFISHQLADIFGPLMGGSEIIQLWHGTPIRKIGYNGDWFANGFIGNLKYFIYKIFPYTYFMTCDKLIAPTKLAKETYVEPFSISFRNNKIDENILLLGQPRNDSLLKNYNFDERFFPEIKKLKKIKMRFDFIVSWLPTHRKKIGKTILDLISESKLDFCNLNEFCEKYNILFVIKPHFLELDYLSSAVNEFKNILVYDEADPYPLINNTDILITDYSSVYFDFLLTNKPIIFAPFDLEEYLDKVKLYFDYEKETPGVKCDNWSSIKSEILLIMECKDRYNEIRKLYLNKIDLVKSDNCKIISDYFFTRNIVNSK